MAPKDQAAAPSAAPGLDLGGQVGFSVAPVRQSIVDQLRSAIIHQQLRPGQRLIERQLTEATGVSRPTIREALQHLSAEGLVITVRGKGWLVATPTYEEAEELYEVRTVLEGVAGRRFAERATDQQVADLKAATERLAKVIREKSTAATASILEQKREFYDILFGGSGDIVASMLGSLQARITALRTLSLAEPGRPQQMLAELRTIVKAVEQRDSEAAERACVAHVRAAAEQALASMRAEGAAAAE